MCAPTNACSALSTASTCCEREIQEYYSNYKVGRDLLELRNLATVAELIIRCALQRKESRGLHYTLDYPELAPIAKDTILVPINFAGQDVIIHRDQV